MSGIFDAVNKFFKVGASGRDKRINDAVSDAEKGKSGDKPSLGNPGGTKKKKKKK